MLGLTRVAANHRSTAALERKSWRWRHKSLNPNIPFSPLLLPECSSLFWKTTSDPVKHAGSDTWDTWCSAVVFGFLLFVFPCRRARARQRASFTRRTCLDIGAGALACGGCSCSGASWSQSDSTHQQSCRARRRSSGSLLTSTCE